MLIMKFKSRYVQIISETNALNAEAEGLLKEAIAEYGDEFLATAK